MLNCLNLLQKDFEKHLNDLCYPLLLSIFAIRLPKFLADYYLDSKKYYAFEVKLGFNSQNVSEIEIKWLGYVLKILKYLHKEIYSIIDLLLSGYFSSIKILKWHFLNVFNDEIRLLTLYKKFDT